MGQQLAREALPFFHRARSILLPLLRDRKEGRSALSELIPAITAMVSVAATYMGATHHVGATTICGATILRLAAILWLRQSI